MHSTLSSASLFTFFLFLSALTRAQTRQVNDTLVTGSPEVLIPFWQSQEPAGMADTLVYDATRDLTAAGGDVRDVLVKIPLLSIDGNGQVCIRGNRKVRFLVDGRPSTLMNTPDALSQIQGESVKYVEVIVSPHLRYDAEGSAGIINIVTKKTGRKGLHLELSGGLGYRPSGVDLRGNYRKGRSNVNFNLGGRADFFSAEYKEEQGERNGSGFPLLAQSSVQKGTGMFKKFRP